MDTKDLDYDKNKKWYRFLKVIYIFFHIATFWFSFLVGTDYSINTLIKRFIFFFLMILIFEILKRSFYYILFGTIRPKQKSISVRPFNIYFKWILISILTLIIDIVITLGRLVLIGTPAHSIGEEPGIIFVRTMGENIPFIFITIFILKKLIDFIKKRNK